MRHHEKIPSVFVYIDKDNNIVHWYDWEEKQLDLFDVENNRLKLLKDHYMELLRNNG